MAEIRGRLGPLFACHVIQRAGRQPHPGMLTPTPARLQLPRGRSRPTRGQLPIPSLPAWPASLYHGPTAGSLVHADLKWE
jgi:hypothetical protein